MTKTRKTNLWRGLIAAMLTLATVPLANAGSASRPNNIWDARGGGSIVVADRSSGTISVIDTRTDEVTDTIALPAGDAAPEPMYVYYTPIMHRVFVGDRANNRVVAYNAETFAVDGIVPAGEGVFHMWGNTSNGQLWVNNDTENTTTVIDMETLDVLATVPTPQDLVDMGGKPHDVILSPGGELAYITVLGIDGPNDYVVQYYTGNFWELDRAAVGKDPHLSVALQDPWLYVPCQNTNDVYVLNRYNLDEVQVLDVPGAHGSGMPGHGRYFYTTNLPAGGEDALYVIDTETLQVVGDPVNTPYTVPHNIAFTRAAHKMYVTHSGPNDKVTVYRTSAGHPMPVYLGEITVGENPFGLAFVPH
ncbi:MAG: YncE family protein [Phycisphaerales bacterium]|nr:MAG: YncE family protein [Phycisphaerales bacterium]